MAESPVFRRMAARQTTVELPVFDALLEPVVIWAALIVAASRRRVARGGWSPAG